VFHKVATIYDIDATLIFIRDRPLAAGVSPQIPNRTGARAAKRR